MFVIPMFMTGLSVPVIPSIEITWHALVVSVIEAEAGLLLSGHWSKV